MNIEESVREDVDVALGQIQWIPKILHDPGYLIFRKFVLSFIRRPCRVSKINSRTIGLISKNNPLQSCGSPAEIKAEDTTIVLEII